jgi:poly(3-hydroxybutyrate) depolymerase
MAQSRLAGRIAAFAPIAGSPQWGYNAAPRLSPSDSPMPLLVMHGTRDGTVPANATPGLPYAVSTQSYIGWRFVPTADVLEKWAEASHCSVAEWQPYTAPLVDPADATANALWCARRCDIVSCTWSGGHQWMGQTPPMQMGNSNGQMIRGKIPAAAELVWGFLSEFSLQRSQRK